MSSENDNHLGIDENKVHNGEKLMDECMEQNSSSKKCVKFENTDDQMEAKDQNRHIDEVAVISGDYSDEKGLNTGNSQGVADSEFPEVLSVSNLQKQDILSQQYKKEYIKGKDALHFHNDEDEGFNDIKTLNESCTSGFTINGEYSGSAKTKFKEADEDIANDNTQSDKWSEILLNYAQQTSFHGLRQITEIQPFILRKLIWLLVFLASAVILLIQVSLSIKHYITWPVSVDLKINYNDSIIFPAVTLCNENAFQMTKAYNEGYYNLISELFDGLPGDASLGENSAGKLSLEKLYQQTSHNKSQFIVSCSWQNVDCKNEFIATLTDFGLCYTFNTGKGKFPVKVAYSTGSEGGLRLQVNIEQYQYMHGPNEGAGLKVLIHSHNEIPLVRDHGLAVPPGSHAFIAIKAVDITNLPPRHGKCNDSVELTYFNQYSVASCYTNCKEHFLDQRCGCRDVYMPSLNNKPKVCTLESYQTCMLEALEDFNKYKENCQCPVPCNRLAYEPTISYASTSNFDIDALLRRNLSSLKQEYISARGTGQKVDKDIVKQDRVLISNFYDNVQKMSSALTNIKSGLTGIEDYVDKLYGSVIERTDIHLHVLEKVHSTLENHFIRGFQVFKEAVFDYVTNDYKGLSNSLKKTMDLAIAYEILDVNDTETRKFVFAPMESLLKRRLELVSSVEHYINLTYNAYTTAEPLIPLNGSHYDQAFISPELLGFNNLQEHLTVRGHQMAKDELVQFTIERLLHVGVYGTQVALGYLIQVGDDYTTTGKFNPPIFRQGEELFVYSVKNYNLRLYLFQKYIEFVPRETIKDEISQFKIANRTLFESYAALKRKIDEIRSAIDSSQESYWKYVLMLAEMSKQYIDTLGTSKVNLGELATSKIAEESIQALQTFFNDLHSKIESLESIFSSLEMNFEGIWKSMLLNRFSEPFYKAVYADIDEFKQLGKIPLEVIMEHMKANSSNALANNNNIDCSFEAQVNTSLNIITRSETQMDNNNSFANSTETVTMCKNYTRVDTEVNRNRYEILLLAFSELLGKPVNFTYNLDIEELIPMLNADMHILNLTEVIEDIANRFNNISDEIKKVSQNAQSDKPFLESFTNYKRSLNEFMLRNEIDFNFYKENFMRLDIYMQELRYEEIIQQKAYDIIQLLGDIGGSMGLFIGGSVISVFEFIDVFIHHGFQKCLKKKTKDPVE